MSRVQDKKDAQGYVGPGESPKCSNCLYFSSDRVNNYTLKNLRCDTGGFAVKQTAYCKTHRPKISL